MNGQIDENAVSGGVDDPGFSGIEISNLIEQETEMLITVVGLLRIKTERGKLKHELEEPSLNT